MECTRCHTPLADEAAYCPRCGTRQEGMPECDVFDYAAFISYRHRIRDRTIATRLQRDIERYILPARAAKAYGSRKIGHVFRDQDELTATPSLPASIRAALRHSRTLVVVCSPDTPKSRWIAQEVELFASYHGRDRIFCALAEGEPAESFPRLLRTRLAPAKDGSLAEVPVEPLAADMRAQVRGRPPYRIERLRIFAAIVGCRFDDLRRRKRAHRLKAVAGVLAIAAIALAGPIDAQRQEMLAAQSSQLAAQAEAQLAEGDRAGAVATALQALPSSEQDGSRPLVPAAQQALEDALGLNPENSTGWQAGFSVPTAHGLERLNDISLYDGDGSWHRRWSDIAVCPEGGYFAVSDVAGTLQTFDLKTGKCLANCTMPVADPPFIGREDGEARYVRYLAAAPDGLVVSSYTNRLLACFDPQTGDVGWFHDGMAFCDVQLMPDPDLVACGSQTGSDPNASNGGFGMTVFNVKTGDAVSSRYAGRTTWPKGYLFFFPPHLAFGADGSRFSMAYNGMLATTHRGKGYLGDSYRNGEGIPEASTCQLDGDKATALFAADDVSIACSIRYQNDSEATGSRYPYAVQAFDGDLHQLWEIEGEGEFGWGADDPEDPTAACSFVFGYPTVRGTVDGGRGVIITAGRTLCIVDPKTGERMHEQSFSSTIMDVLALPDPADFGGADLLVARMDGTVRPVSLSGDAGESDLAGLTLAFADCFRWADLSIDDGVVTCLGIPALEDGKVACFRLDPHAGAKPAKEHSLDELVQMGNDFLKRRGA